jgi:hypothetical protein
MYNYRPTPPPPESSISAILSNLAAIDALVAALFFGPQPAPQGAPSPFINVHPRTPTNTTPALDKYSQK